MLAVGVALARIEAQPTANVVVDAATGARRALLRKFPHPETDTTLIPKFREPDNLKIVVAGGTAGRFSAIVPGWSFARGSRLVLRKIANA